VLKRCWCLNLYHLPVGAVTIFSQVRAVKKSAYIITLNDLRIFHGGRAVAQAVSRWLPTATDRAGMWGLWRPKRYWSMFSPSTSVSPTNHHSTNFSIIIITQDWPNKSVGDRSAEWIRLASTPHYQLKKNKIFYRSP
jgi:hypothetical protein